MTNAIFNKTWKGGEKLFHVKILKIQTKTYLSVIQTASLKQW